MDNLTEDDRVDPVLCYVRGCWVWTGPYFRARKSPGNRYGYISIYFPETQKSKTISVHKAMWLATKGKPSKGMCICHTCDNPLCCNPDHLWLGTQRENLHDMVVKGRHNYKDKPYCKRGHPLSGDNVRIDKQVNGIGIRRTCLECERMRTQSPKYKAKAVERQRQRREAMRKVAA